MKLSHLALAAFLAALVVSSVPAQTSDPSRFRIEVRTESGEILMRCTQGCVWETLSVGCNANEPCAFVLDQNGMGQ